MKPDKKQVPQLIALGLLVVAFIGFLSFKVIAPRTEKKLETTSVVKKAESVKQDDKTGDETQATATVALESQILGVFPDLAAVPARRDPFAPQKLGGSADAFDKSKPVNTSPKPIRAPRGLERVPSLSIPPMNPYGIGNDNTGKLPRVSVAPAELDPQFTLTGIVRGDGNVVIIRTSDNGRYVLKQGQLIDGRYKVLYVTPDGVVLAYKNRRIHVKLGGVKNAN
jgi:hypothetical protein